MNTTEKRWLDLNRAAADPATFVSPPGQLSAVRSTALSRLERVATGFIYHRRDADRLGGLYRPVNRCGVERCRD
ncbi:hypothetical protein A4G26_11595 [Mycobacterium kansasii]|uniref:Uncharacterized protein n=1 Tax=Mycobacterium innocens TaxID=2341083 RepID=A0A498Q4W4_9MYCO|nr:hypothetical protein [Mycobacterium innocens]KZS59856.1 hypothetical protein A4G26_11595 [Mycobacterium kansasii]KZS78412.1 hypothetical protein A4G29_24355 [Mycobacterium kansasii]VBA38850.1 hypothetical protein LAUMK13_02313 [Mycobacterium innocens]